MMDRLENSFHQATRFSADASHELKTPLAIMQGELENALQEALPGSKEQQVFSNLLEETQRLKTITRGLLLLARADAGQLKPAMEPVNLSDLLGEIIEDTRILAAESRLVFEVELAAGITIPADPGLLHTALLNLFVNAVKFNEPGGTIRVSLESLGSEAILTISNSGPGIPAGDQDRIFTRFHRVDAARQRKVEGIGLGLSLAREIVRAHGGELDLQESRPGWTSFRMRMRLEETGPV
jgi:signal transduction histidine kinase